jgi:hypothetical protein
MTWWDVLVVAMLVMLVLLVLVATSAFWLLVGCRITDTHKRAVIVAAANRIWLGTSLLIVVVLTTGVATWLVAR